MISFNTIFICIFVRLYTRMQTYSTIKLVKHDCNKLSTFIIQSVYATVVSQIQSLFYALSHSIVY